jgi:hypothetical protein
MNILGLEFFLRFGIHAIALLVLLRFTFFRFSNDRDSLFSFSLFGHGVFIVAGLLHNVDISMGFAFGLFAVFSMLRYRTESISVRNMTYLFLVIVVSLISSVGPVSLIELAIINTLICAITAACETRALAPRFETSTLSYGRMKNLKPQHRGNLLSDLSELTGLNVEKVEVLDRNFKTKVAKLKIYYPKPILGTEFSTFTAAPSSVLAQPSEQNIHFETSLS